MKRTLFEGTATAMITPFKKTGIDFTALSKLLDKQIEGGVDAVVMLGTTGEPATMSQAEKDAVLTLAVKKLKGIIPIIAGAGSNSTEQAIQNAVRAEALGADGLLVVTPYYNKCTDRGLIAHYSAIAKATTLPIIVYNVPSRTGVNVRPEVFARLAEIDNIVGIKEASGNMSQIAETIRLTRDTASVYSGDDALTIPTMSLGGKGVISVASNPLPSYVSTMADAWLKGDASLAQKMQLDLLPLVNALFKEVNPIPVKKACELLNLCDGTPRLPLTPATRKTTLLLKRELAKLNAI